MLGLFVLKS